MRTCQQTAMMSSLAGPPPNAWAWQVCCRSKSQSCSKKLCTAVNAGVGQTSQQSPLLSVSISSSSVLHLFVAELGPLLQVCYDCNSPAMTVVTEARICLYLCSSRSLYSEWWPTEGRIGHGFTGCTALTEALADPHPVARQPQRWPGAAGAGPESRAWRVAPARRQRQCRWS